MALPTLSPKVKLIIGCLYKSETQLEETRMLLSDLYGSIDSQSGAIPFVNSDYYRDIGDSLLKKLFSFQELIEPEKIVEIKLRTNDIELEISKKSNRDINIDPGYLSLSNLYLASCKPFYHRAYLSKGIYLENEYYFSKKKFCFWDWTYPDYKQEAYLEFFYKVRHIYKSQLG